MIRIGTRCVRACHALFSTFGGHRKCARKVQYFTVCCQRTSVCWQVRGSAFWKIWVTSAAGRTYHQHRTLKLVDIWLFWLFFWLFWLWLFWQLYCVLKLAAPPPFQVPLPAGWQNKGGNVGRLQAFPFQIDRNKWPNAVPGQVLTLCMSLHASVCVKVWLGEKFANGPKPIC